MNLSRRTTGEDIQIICSYLSTKPTGATLKEAKAVIDKKYLDTRKLTALTNWGLIEEVDGKFKVTRRGREVAKGGGVRKAPILCEVIREIEPYRAIIERVVHRGESSLSATEVGAHWHEHFNEQVSESDEIINEQAICFFQIAQGADLGELIVGRRGSPTRFEFLLEATEFFVSGESAITSDLKDYNEDKVLKTARDVPAIPTSTQLEEKLGQAIFIAHGKDTDSVDQLKKILDQFQIPYKVAVDEPNLGRPISQKVREIMELSNCAIFIFTTDEEYRDKDGNVVWRPSENVVYELGAAGYLYDSRIVIMKQAGVTFPSDFQDLGYIQFEKGQLEARAMDILKELIGFGIVKVTT